tara:strand:+ start:552 stop:746 length:195 start_codon:yes stop_codon:yes gene_type:complete
MGQGGTTASSAWVNHQTDGFVDDDHRFIFVNYFKLDFAIGDKCCWELLTDRHINFNLISKRYAI